jgi:hypothetical protein
VTGEMTAVAAYLLGSQAVVRDPDENAIEIEVAQ